MAQPTHWVDVTVEVDGRIVRGQAWAVLPVSMTLHPPEVRDESDST